VRWRLMGNAVFLELKRKQKERPWLEIYYYRDYQQREYAVDRDEIERREVEALLKASYEFNCKDLIIITWDYEDELAVKNRLIKCVPLWKRLIA